MFDLYMTETGVLNDRPRFPIRVTAVSNYLPSGSDNGL
jgi:hypothetical protein